jgi:hypothetical protein
MAEQNTESAAHAATNNTNGTAEPGPGFAAYAGTLAAVSVAAALIEVELVPGILIGAGALLAPKLMPKIVNAFRPALKGALRAGYQVAGAARETIAEASEQFQDVVAEVQAERAEAVHSEANAPAASANPSGPEAQSQPHDNSKHKRRSS